MQDWRCEFFFLKRQEEWGKRREIRAVGEVHQIKHLKSFGKLDIRTTKILH